MRSLPFLSALVLLAACPPVDTGVEAPVAEPLARPAALPEPLPESKFEMPATETRTLSNGLKVIVANNPEVPLWDVRLLFDVGGFADPSGKEGLASVTLDMMNEGAGDLSAEDIARQLKRLGASIGTWADDDGAGLSASGPKRNLEPTLDLWAKILLEPTFPQADWEINRRQRIANLQTQKEDPNAIASRVLPHILYAETYRGRLVDEASLGAITTDDMKKFRSTYLGPENAILLVGGDVTADEIVPLLEARIGSWKPEGIQSPEPEVKLVEAETPVLYLIDKPGAAQSVVRLVMPTIDRLDPDYFAMYIANSAFGGAFTSRVNMNLREDKGYTYGARCGFTHRYGPGLWACGTSVETSVTGPAITEIRKELDEVRGERAFSGDEIGFYKSSEVRSFPMSYEVTDAILNEKAAIWRYGLPEDWTERFVPGVEKVTLEQANQAWKDKIVPDELIWLVVGDAAKIRKDVEALGFRIVELDRDGQPIQGSK